MPVDVSVIIPAFNRLWCLPIAIESCRNTRCKTEIIVVDDGSTDGTWEWIQEQSDVVSVRQSNQGQTYAINHGVSLAQGTYIRFLDSDDFLTEGTIDAQFDCASSTDAQLVYSRVDSFDFKSKKVIKEHNDPPLWSDFLAVQLSNQYGSHFLGMLFHRDLVLKVPRRPDFALREDRMFLLEIGLLFPKIATVPRCAGYWVQHDSQMQANYDGLKSIVANWQHLNIFKKILAKLDVDNELTQVRKNAACTVLWPLAHWIAKTSISEAANILIWIKQLNPDFEIPETGILGLMYKKLGFVWTERILTLRRLITSRI